MPRGRTYWMVASTLENFRITQNMGFTLQGLMSRQRRKAQRMEPGDRLVTTSPGFSALVPLQLSPLSVLRIMILFGRAQVSQTTTHGGLMLKQMLCWKILVFLTQGRLDQEWNMLRDGPQSTGPLHFRGIYTFFQKAILSCWNKR